MKAKKAIEILTEASQTYVLESQPDTFDAIKLGIAALTRHINRDYITYAGMHEPLPGETNE